MIFVGGEKGTGKTRLVQEFIIRALVRSDTIIPAAGAGNPATGDKEPFLPFRGVMEMLASEVDGGKHKDMKPLRLRVLFPEARVREDDLHRERLGRIAKTVKWVLAESAQELASVWVPGLGFGRSLLERLAGEKGMAPQAWEERAFSQYQAFIARLSDAFPLILFLDDFHWADASSRGMLYSLAEMSGRHRLLILVTWRPQDPESSSILRLQQELETRHWASSLPLDLLDVVPEHVARMTEFVDQFIDRNYNPNGLDQDFRARLVERTEGHALIVEETLRQFRQEGTIAQDSSGRWVLAREPAWDRLPREVEGMVRHRLEGLSEEDLRLLHAAAVAAANGEDFTVQLVAKVLHLNDRQVRQRLDGELGRRRELVLASFYEATAVARRTLDIYRWRHQAFQEYLYLSLSQGERRDLHADATLALRDLLGEAWSAEPALFAYHAQRGERWAELGEACLHLARRQRIEYEASAAAKTAQEGLAALDRVRDETDRRELRAGLDYELGLAFYYSDRYPEARERYEEALPIFRDIQDRLGEANTIQALGHVHMALAEYPEARKRYEEALPIFRQIKARLGEANTLTGVGSLDLAENKPAAAQNLFEQASRIYREIGDRHWQTYVAPRLAQALLAQGDTERARQTLEQGEEIARSIEGRPSLRVILVLLAQLRMEQKNLIAALDCYDELLSLSPDNVGFLHSRANVLFDLKAYTRALGDYRRLVELDAQDAWAHNGIGNVMEKQGDLEGAVAAYSKAIEAKKDEPAFVRNRASTLIALGRLDEARADCEGASSLAADDPYTHGRWGDLHLGQGEWGQAEVEYHAALAKDDSVGWRFGLAAALWGSRQMDKGWSEFDAALQKADADARAETAQDYARLLSRQPTIPFLAEAIERLKASSD